MLQLLWFIVGAVGWSLSEYIIHRFDGHGMKGNTPFSREHLAHHGDPKHYAETWKKVVLAVLVFCALAAISRPILGSLCWSMSSGFMLSYGLYEIIHRRIHTHSGMGPYGRWLRQHHLAHHFTDPKKNFSITTPVWDILFGTYQRVEGPILVPRQRAPVWMVTATNDLRPDLSELYRLRGQR